MRRLKITNTIVKIYKALLPSPLAIALFLTLFVAFLAIAFGDFDSSQSLLPQLYGYWTGGLWNNGLLVFAVQMMLMLVLGHVLALSGPFEKLIAYFVKQCHNTASAAFLVTLTTLCVALFNWGLGLIFGAILSRKVAEHALRNQIKINYPLIGAAGYSGLMVWHGGFSGSSLAKVAEEGHLKSLANQQLAATLPSSIDFGQTVFSTMNIAVSVVLVIVLSSFMYFLGKRVPTMPVKIKVRYQQETIPTIEGAERVDHAKAIGLILGFLILLGIGYTMATDGVLSFFNPNNINLLLLGLGFLFHRSIYSFSQAVGEAIEGAAGILIQFPLYFGIMGIMKDAGLASQLSQFFVSISNEVTYPIFTFISAGIVNVFVPSGGGQWAIQGPIIIEAANALNVSLPKSILAMAYGDQLTNMLQPFWALPLLGITGLKAKQILPYTLLLMLVGTVIFISALLLF